MHPVLCNDGRGHKIWPLASNDRRRLIKTCLVSCLKCPDCLLQTEGGKIKNFRFTACPQTLRTTRGQFTGSLLHTRSQSLSRRTVQIGFTINIIHLIQCLGCSLSFNGRWRHTSFDIGKRYCIDLLLFNQKIPLRNC